MFWKDVMVEFVRDLKVQRKRRESPELKED